MPKAYEDLMKSIGAYEKSGAAERDREKDRKEREEKRKRDEEEERKRREREAKDATGARVQRGFQNMREMREAIDAEKRPGRAYEDLKPARGGVRG